MNKFVRLAVAVVMLAILPACQGIPEVGAEPMASAPLMNTPWKLTSLYGADVQTLNAGKTASLTLSANETRARIVTACNGGSASFTVEGRRLKFGAAISTKMMCEQAQMLQEKKFMQAINDTERYEINGETLELYDAGNQLLASFRPE